MQPNQTKPALVIGRRFTGSGFHWLARLAIYWEAACDRLAFLKGWDLIG